MKKLLAVFLSLLLGGRRELFLPGVRALRQLYLFHPDG